MKVWLCVLEEHEVMHMACHMIVVHPVIYESLNWMYVANVVGEDRKLVLHAFSYRL